MIRWRGSALWMPAGRLVGGSDSLVDWLGRRRAALSAVEKETVFVN